jgi:hypothetical protein
MYRNIPFNLLDAQNAGSTLAKTAWPGTYTNALPAVGGGGISTIVNTGNVIGAVFAPRVSEAAYSLNFLCLGSAGQALVLEIGMVDGANFLTQPLASVSLNAITTGTFTNLDPFTGDAPTGTWRLFDTAVITTYGDYNQVIQTLNGFSTGNTTQIQLDTQESVYYYVLVTNLNSLTRARVDISPLSTPIVRNNDSVISPAGRVANVTPSDTVDLPAPSRGISFAVAGALEIIDLGGVDTTIPSGSLAAGIIHPIRATRIKNAGTTATSIVAYW